MGSGKTKKEKYEKIPIRSHTHSAQSHSYRRKTKTKTKSTILSLPLPSPCDRLESQSLQFLYSQILLRPLPILCPPPRAASPFAAAETRARSPRRFRGISLGFSDLSILTFFHDVVFQLR